MTGTIHPVLDRRHEALDGRDKGNKFEHPIRAYLTTDPRVDRGVFRRVLWSDWPGRDWPIWGTPTPSAQARGGIGSL